MLVSQSTHPLHGVVTAPAVRGDDLIPTCRWLLLKVRWRCWESAHDLLPDHRRGSLPASHPPVPQLAVARSIAPEHTRRVKAAEHGARSLSASSATSFNFASEAASVLASSSCRKVHETKLHEHRHPTLHFSCRSRWACSLGNDAAKGMGVPAPQYPQNKSKMHSLSAKVVGLAHAIRLASRSFFAGLLSLLQADLAAERSPECSVRIHD